VPSRGHKNVTFLWHQQIVVGQHLCKSLACRDCYHLITENTWWSWGTGLGMIFQRVGNSHTARISPLYWYSLSGATVSHKHCYAAGSGWVCFYNEVIVDTNACTQCLNCEKRSGGTLEARRRGERRMRENRGAVGAEGEGRGRVSPSQLTRESGGALWAPPAGSGAEPRPKTNFVHFVAARTLIIETICLISVSLNTAVVLFHYCFERCKKVQ